MVYASVILVVSSIPDLRSPGRWSGSDKLMHALEYAILGGLLRRAVLVRGARGWIVALALAAAIGAIDELYQATVPGRFCSRWDWIADLSGAAIGSAFQPVLRHWWVEFMLRRKPMGG